MFNTARRTVRIIGSLSVLARVPYDNAGVTGSENWTSGFEVNIARVARCDVGELYSLFRTLYVTPLYEQIRRFSNNYVRPFIDRSPIKPLWSGTSTENSVLQRSFKNLSMMIFSFALMDADRVRGISADKVAIDEVQDMDPDHLPIIREVMSHSKYGLFQFTGVLAPSFG